ncbi:MAG: hypothetical protein RL557_618 [archaeon]
MDDTPPFYKGSEGFAEVLKNERLSRPGRVIRVYNYAANARDEVVYVIGTEKQLFDTGGNKVNAQDVLSEDAAPNGWSVEGLELNLLSDEELRKLI